MSDTITTTHADAASTPGSLLDQVLAKQAELAALRKKVRLIIIAQHERNWCRPGRQAVLDELGLDPIENAYRGKAAVNVEFDSLPTGHTIHDVQQRIREALQLGPSTDPDVQFHQTEVRFYLDQGEVRYDNEGNAVDVSYD